MGVQGLFQLQYVFRSTNAPKLAFLGHLHSLDEHHQMLQDLLLVVYSDPNLSAYLEALSQRLAGGDYPSIV